MQRLRLLCLGAALIGILVAAGYAMQRWAQTHAEAVASEEAEQVARSHLGLLSSELQKFRLLPLVLTEYPDVAEALETGSATVLARLNAKLEVLAERTGTAVIYVLRPDGYAIAASNWRFPTSFVGKDYSYRPYVRDALRDGSAELFAQGTVTGRPGLFISQRIQQGRRVLGVIVVKVEFDKVEAGWAQQVGPTFVVDRNGAVIVTSVPAERFRTLPSVSPQKREALLRSAQYGSSPLLPLDFAFDDRTVRRSGKSGEMVWRLARIAAPIEGGQLYYLQPLAPALAAATASARAAALAALLVALTLIGLRWRSQERAAIQRRARAELESEVALRTAELTRSNRRLQEESFEREQAEARSRAARDELAQASRLSYIGQITTGVAHEINQPLATIRTLAENGQKLLARGDVQRTEANLGTIVGLTAQVGAITAELRSFSRRGARRCEPVAIDRAIEGALLLTRDRMRSSGVSFVRNCEREGMMVIADRIGLEQVLVNLIQNAIEAMEGRGCGRILLTILQRETWAVAYVEDDGPGIEPSLVDELFTPFVTGRPEGLGLGLSIARDLVREFGGDLRLDETGPGGTRFELRLKLA